jgi:hypothetical protein
MRKPAPRRYTLLGLRGLCAQFVIYRMAQYMRDGYSIPRIGETGELLPRMDLRGLATLRQFLRISFIAPVRFRGASC